ncbi:MAG TPA: hypothetical protein VJB11_02485 [archaeon]|nr:hypothetical protein [archaeon]
MSELFKVELSKDSKEIQYICDIEALRWPDNGAMRAGADKFLKRQEYDALYKIISTEDGEISLVRKKNVFKKPVRKGQILGHISIFPTRLVKPENIDKMFQYLDRIREMGWESVCSEFGLPINWHVATKSGYLEENGESVIDFSSKVYNLINISIHSDYGGKIEGKKRIIDYGIEGMKSDLIAKGGLYVFGYTRDLKSAIECHIDNGGYQFGKIPECMPEDLESNGRGELVIYKL